MCPKGDDPLTDFTDYRVITLTTNATQGFLNGTLRFTFNGESFNFPANASAWNESDCEKAFESLRNVDDVVCSRAAVTNRLSSSFTIQFRSFPIHPYENNIFSNDGNPPLSAFYCDTSDVNKHDAKLVTCTITDVVGDTYPGRICMPACRRWWGD